MDKVFIQLGEVFGEIKYNKIEIEELNSFSKGPILGSYLINDKLFAPWFLWNDCQSNPPDKTLVSIAKNLRIRDYSSYIPNIFITQDLYGDEIYFEHKENAKLKTEEDLCIELARLKIEESNASFEFEKFLQNLGYDVSIERGENYI